MDTITTIQSLLKSNGCAQPVTVVLTQSDCRLIAAAPELLEALKALCADELQTQDKWDAARAAIAKAEGK